MLSGANLLVLDEPTNHLDIESIETLEAAIEAFEGTAIFISHDRYFLDRMADRVVEVRDGAARSVDRRLQRLAGASPDVRRRLPPAVASGNDRAGPPAASDAGSGGHRRAFEPSEPPPSAFPRPRPRAPRQPGTALLGILLITVGVFFFIGQWLTSTGEPPPGRST